jgi:hypothetical protein
MIVGTFSKILNQTEVGETGAHGQSPQLSVDMMDSVNYIFDNGNVSEFDMSYDFYDKRENTQTFKLRYIKRKTSGIMVLIGDIGKYFKKYSITAGDELILSVEDDDGVKRRYIDFVGHRDRVMFQNIGKAFKIIKGTRLNHLYIYNVLTEGQQVKIEIDNIKQETPRSDSPATVTCCDLFFNDNNMLNNIKANTVYLLDTKSGTIKLNTWKFNKIEI